MLLRENKSCGKAE